MIRVRSIGRLSFGVSHVSVWGFQRGHRTFCLDLGRFFFYYR